mmetsp:Transcript_43814/g.140470  ORF Transcript_43814/g.140470 Transcript_43814/m.140470 type:complete len:413 (-) Transcript_43814:413-1651(-)
MASSMQEVLALGCLLGLHLLRLGLHLAQEQGQAGDIPLLDLVDAIVELLQLHGFHQPSLQVHTALAARQRCLHLLLMHHGSCGAAPRVAHRLFQVRLRLHLLGIEQLEGGLEFLHAGAQVGQDSLHLRGDLRRLKQRRSLRGTPLDFGNAVVDVLLLQDRPHARRQVSASVAVHHRLNNAVVRNTGSRVHLLMQPCLLGLFLGIKLDKLICKLGGARVQLGDVTLRRMGRCGRCSLRHKDLLENRLLHLNCGGHLGLDLLHLRSILHSLLLLLLVLLLSLLLPFHGLLFGDQLAQRLLFLEEVLLELEDLQFLFLVCEHRLLFNQLALHLGNLARSRSVRQVVLQTRKLLDGPRDLLALSITHQFPSLDLIHDAVHRGGDHLGLRQHFGAHVAALNQLFQAALHGRQLPLRF